MATFSVNDQARRAQSTGNGSATDFSFSFQVNATSDVKVYVGDTLKTLSTHYTIVDSSAAAGLNTDGTGVVKFITSPTDYTPADGDVVTILSDVPVARTSVYTSGGNITAASLESDFDTITMQVADREERDGRQLTAPVSDPTSIDMTLPAKASRLGKALGFNSSSGNPEAITVYQTAADVRAAVEAASDSNVFTDADHSKLNGIAASANNYSHPNHTGDVTSSGDGATTIAADAVTGAKIADDAVDSEHIANGAIDLAHMSANSVDSDQYVDGSIDTAHIGDDQVTYAKIQNVSATNVVLGRDSSGAGVIEEISASSLRTILNVEDGADVTDATNVTAAGALMDSEVTNLSQVKAFDSSDYATAAQGSTADAAMAKSGGTFTGDVNFGDGDKAIFGAGSDIQIYHDASGGGTSYINGGGAGNLLIIGDDLYLNSSNGENMIKAVEDGAVTLYFNGASKLQTSASGADVTGRLQVANGATSSGYIDLLEDSDNGTNKIKLEAPQTISSDKTITLPDTAGNVGLDTTAGGVLLLSTTISDDASVEFSSSYITSDFRHYIVELSEIVPATNDTRLRMQMGTANSADTGTNYLWITQSTGVSASDTNEFYWASSSSTAYIQVTSSSVNEMGTGTGENFNALLKIYNVNSTSAYKTVGSLDSFPSYGEGEYSVATQFLTGTYTNQSAVNYLKFYSSSGNLTSGTAKLWGVR